MASIDVGNDGSAGEGHGFVVFVRANELEGILGVGEGVEGDDGRLSTPVCFLVQIVCIALLDVGGIP